LALAAAEKAGIAPSLRASGSKGVHAVRMELACRGYLDERQGEVDLANWPCTACVAFASAARA
jgi:N-formylglutamate amidohydrolase